MGQRAHACAYPTRRPIANIGSAPRRTAGVTGGCGRGGQSSNLRVRSARPVRSASLVPLGGVLARDRDYENGKSPRDIHVCFRL